MANSESEPGDLQERMAEWMQALPRQPEPPLTNDELRWLRRFRKEKDHRAWLRKQVFVFAPIVTTVVVAIIAVWKWVWPFLVFAAGSK